MENKEGKVLWDPLLRKLIKLEYRLQTKWNYCNHVKFLEFDHWTVAYIGICFLRKSH